MRLNDGALYQEVGDVMKPWDAAGYLASGLVVMAFCMEDIVLLRAVALTSNVAFLIYGIGLGLVPVWLLHATLLPVNGWRLWQVIARRSTGRSNGEPRHEQGSNTFRSRAARGGTHD
jgi:hypothetical protein